MESLLFTLYALAACGGAIAVVLSQNVARMAFWLVVSLGSVAGLFFMLNADFVGATQLLIYVGGTVVLLIFGVMLTGTSPGQKMETNPAELIMASIIGLGFLAVVVPTVTSVDWEGNRATLSHAGVHSHPGEYNQGGEGSSSRHIGAALLGVRVDQVDAAGAHEHAHAESAHAEEHAHEHAHAVESSGRSGYLLPFEIISVHLLVVLIGASYLARAKRRVEAAA